MRTAFAFIIVLLSASPSLAQWIFQKTGGEFDDNPMYIALTAKGSYALGVRCQGKDVSIIFLTPEKMSEKNVSMANTLGVKLKLKIDGGKIFEMDSDLEMRDENLVAISEIDAALLKGLSESKSKISLAMAFGGSNFHEFSFDAKGASSVIGRLIKVCKTT